MLLFFGFIVLKSSVPKRGWECGGISCVILGLLLFCFVVLKVLLPKREWGCDGIDCIRTQCMKVRIVS
jgi:hypothetical protein